MGPKLNEAAAGRGGKGLGNEEMALAPPSLRLLAALPCFTQFIADPISLPPYLFLSLVSLSLHPSISPSPPLSPSLYIPPSLFLSLSRRTDRPWAVARVYICRRCNCREAISRAAASLRHFIVRARASALPPSLVLRRNSNVCMTFWGQLTRHCP